MEVTVVKIYEGREVVKASQTVSTLEDLILFTQKLGYVQSLDAYVEDFQNFNPVVYRMGL